MKTTNTTGVIAAAARKNIPAEKHETPANVMKNILNAKATKQLLADTLKQNAGVFAASVLDLYSSDTYLQKCAPQAVFRECLKAASLKLPISKALGFAYVIPYKNEPQFQIGYKGLIQLAQRTGAYKYINSGPVYEGEFKGEDKLTGEIDISGEKTSDVITGYFAYIETLNGFKKAYYWSKDKVINHAKRYSKSYNSKSGAWTTNFDEMAMKTVLKNLLTHYGFMSVEMADAFEAEENTAEADKLISDEEPVFVSAQISDSEEPENPSDDISDDDDVIQEEIDIYMEQ